MATVHTPHIQSLVLGATVEGVAEAFYLLNSHIYMFSEETGWYYLRAGNLWYPTRKLNILKGMSFITEYIKEMCEAVLGARSVWSASDDSDGEHVVVSEEGVDSRFLVAKKKVGSKTFLKNVAGALRRYYYREGLAEHMYERQRGLFAFEDCVMDMRTLERRPIQPEDCIVKTCGYKYQEPAEEEIEAVRMMLEKAVPDAELLRYLLRTVAGVLGGSGAPGATTGAAGASRPIHILRDIPGGRTGKDTFLHLCRMTFRRYWGEMHYHHLMMKWSAILRSRTDSFVDLEFCKFALCDEPYSITFPLRDNSLRGDTLKVFAGGAEGQKIPCKRMGSRFHTKYVPQFYLWIDVSDTPKIRGGSDSDLDVRILRFPAAAAEGTTPRLTEQAKGRGFFGLLLRVLREGGLDDTRRSLSIS